MGVLEVPPELAGQSGLYNTPDPLLRRLRLEDQSGRPIVDLDKFFKEQEVVIIYAGSEHGSQNLKELHRNLTSTALKNYKTTSILYVSTDTDPKAQQRITKDVPWLRMTFNDNSDFAPLVSSGQDAKITEIEDVERGEDFVQAGEIEVGAEKVQLGEEEYRELGLRPRAQAGGKHQENASDGGVAGEGGTMGVALKAEHDYVRPLSRAALTCLMRAYSTPSLSVYHIPSHTFVARNLRKDAFSPKNIDENLRTWRNGGTQSLSFLDVVGRMKWAMLLLALSAIYRLVIMYGGDSYNVLPGFIDQLRFTGKQA